MKLFTSIGPNPRIVRMFLLEKGVQIPTVDVDLLGGENRRGEYLEKNPAGQLPALELDDGRVVGETVAICEYVEEKHPRPALIGATAEERAETRMWQRRVELNVSEHILNGFRYAEGLALFQNRIPTIPEAADGLKSVARKRLEWLDGLLAGKQFLAGDRFSLADIILFAVLDFGATVGQPLDPGLKHVGAWFARIAERPSAKAG
jgi:glutathione S-transferase